MTFPRETRPRATNINPAHLFDSPNKPERVTQISLPFKAYGDFVSRFCHRKIRSVFCGKSKAKVFIASTLEKLAEFAAYKICGL